MRRLVLASLLLAAGCHSAAVRAPEPPAAPPAWDSANAVRPLPKPPLGSGADFAKVPWVTPEKARLGRWLFFDKRLSADGTISCATCHDPRFAYSEAVPTSTGIRGQVGKRKSPPVLNAAWPREPVFFWDGRAKSLAEQAKGPIENPIEMGNTHAAAAKTIAGIPGYRPYFREACGDARVDIDRIAEAIAAYEATRLSGNSAYDRFDAGDEKALSEEAIEGRDLFFGRARCSACHLGPSFTDARFHNLGVGFGAPPAGKPAAEGFADRGRFEVTKAEKDLGAFKTPTLRNLLKRGPYMHDGSMKTLREVVVFYMRGGEENPWLAPDARDASIRPCEVDALVAFLESLEGTGHEDEPPVLFPQ